MDRDRIRLPLLIGAVRVEQHGQCQVAPLGHLHACDIADFQVVGHRRNRALVGLDDVEGDACGVGQQGAAPTAWPKRADRCQGQDAGAKRDDRTVGREVVGRRSRRGGDHHAVADQFVQPRLAVEFDREVRGLQQKSLGQTNGFTDSEYEILVDIALGLTDRAIAKRRSLSLRSVQNRLQQLYDKLDVYQAAGDDHEDGRFNLRARAVTVAFLRKLLNYSALERAEAELQEWLEGR